MYMNKKIKSIIEAIELLQDSQLDSLMKFIRSLKTSKKLSPQDVPTIDLGGAYDDINLREHTYETSVD